MNDSDPDTIIEKIRTQVQPKAKSDWDYKVALVVITILAFITRFYGIRHPNQVVFDEVHFGKVRYAYYFTESHGWMRKLTCESSVRVVLPPTNLLL